MARPISLLLALSILTIGSPGAAEHRTLFVGNSYTFANNDLLAHGFEALLAESGGGEPEVDLVTKGGYTFVGHLEDAGLEGEQLHELLGVDGAAWTVVVLQEQSVIPAYHAAIASGWYDSLGAAKGLDELASKAGAETIFLMTWGRREGLSQDAAFLPDFITMSELLAGGYEKYAEYTSTPERPVRVAPAGLAWQAIWEDAVAAGKDPLDPNGLFWNLYTGDGSHPSELGSYLAALVVFATVTGNDPTETLWQPDSVTPEEAQTLRSVAKRVVFGEPVPPPVEVIETDVTTQPPEEPLQSDLTTNSDLPVAETIDQQDLPRVAPETLADLPAVTAPDGSAPAPGKGSGCGASSKPSPLAGLVLLMALLMAGVWRRVVR